MHKKVLFLLLVLFLTSCNNVLLLIAKGAGELIEPQKETPAGIIGYCGQMTVNYDQLYMIKSQSTYSAFVNKYKNLPGIFVFDKNKYLVKTVGQNNCPWTLLNLPYDTTIQRNRVENTELYNEIMSDFTLINSKTEQVKFDYYIFCSWAKYTPKLTKALFETVNKQKKENKLNVCHILLNVDLQESWTKN